MRRRPTVRLMGLAFTLVCTIAVAAPDPPSNPAPTPGADGVRAAATLCVDVSDMGGGSLDVEFFGRDLAATPAEDFDIVAMPDTQNYALLYHSIFYGQTEWIVENRESRNIVFVSHVGDIVEQAKVPNEWIVADIAMSTLEDPALTELAEGIPYGLCVGNHDQFPNDRPGNLYDQSATTPLFNQYFPVSRYEPYSWYGGHFGDNNDNTYQLFEAGGMKFIAIHLEYDDQIFEPELLDAVMDWTEEVLETYSDHRAIITAHSMLCDEAFCQPYGSFSAQGQIIYDRVKHYPNVFLMLCGHQGTIVRQPRRTDVFEGNTIYTTLQNYQRGQNCPYECGRGWLRNYTFKPSEDKIVAETYSPWLDEFMTDDCIDGPGCHAFELPYDMNGGIHFEQIGGTVSVPSGGTACATWNGRTITGDYEWYVTVSDGTETIEGPRWTFTSDGECMSVSECDEGDPCTQESCVSDTCARFRLPNCCETADDCDDGNYCTDDVCNGGTCEFTNNTLACSDGDPCTTSDVCQSGQCVAVPAVCDDANGCTTDVCVDGDCTGTYEPSAGCCVTDADCWDGDHCTEDTCGPGGDCSNTPIPGCCDSIADCPDDGDACTIEACPVWNTGALVLDEPGEHVSMYRSLGLEHFTIECWFKWDGGGDPVQTYNWLWAFPFDDEGINAYPLVTKGFADQEFGVDDDGLVQDLLSVNYFLGIAAPDAEHPEPVLAADFEEHSTGSADWGVNHPVYGTTPIELDRWYHAAVTYDGSCWQLYLDGVPELHGENCPNEPAAYDSKMQFAIGTALDQWGGYLAHVANLQLDEGWFSGLIDEVRLWDHARTPAEIAANVNRAIEAAPGLVGRWGLDGIEPGSDFIATDSVGAHDGVVVKASFSFTDLPELVGGVCEAPLLLPADVSGVSVASQPDTTLSWQALGGGEVYDVASGLLSELAADAGVSQAECLSDDQAGSQFVDVRPPPPVGDGYYYMIRGETGCGAGSYGLASSGAERLPAAACP